MEQRLCKILRHVEPCSDYPILTLEWENASSIFKPGQFVEIKVSNTTDPLIRRPFSIYSTDKNSFSIAYKVLGKGTSELRLRKENEILDVIGPLGNGYDFSDLSTTNVVLVAGGTGVASIFYLAKVLKKINIDFKIYLGFRSINDIFCMKDWEEFKDNLVVATEDGSFSEKGFVTEFIKTIDDKQNIIFSCGPEKMIQSVIKKFHSDNTKIQASMESYMACGIGICNGCVIKIKDKDKFIYKKVCKDGPVFNAEEILWE